MLCIGAAALVIQGSACVYSRKVEYLHGLVYQALEVIADNKRCAADGDGTRHWQQHLPLGQAIAGL